MKTETRIAIAYVPNPWTMVAFRWEQQRGVWWGRDIVPALKRYFKTRGIKPTEMGVDGVMVYEKGRPHSEVVLEWWETTTIIKIVYNPTTKAFEEQHFQNSSVQN